jgi:glutamine kinase
VNTTPSDTIRLGTKAESLARLSSAVTKARVLPLHLVALPDWQEHRERELDRITAQDWAGGPLIVRSSAAAEDSFSESMAGQFLSLQGLRGRDELARAIDDVFSSYGGPGSDDQVLVQPQLRGSWMSGVACSCHPSTGAPYYVVNWVESAATDAVTSGAEGKLHTWYGARYSSAARPPSAPIAGVLALLAELRALTSISALDIEFAVSDDDELILLQVRPLVAGGARIPEARHHSALDGIAQSVAAGQQPAPEVPGRRAIYGVMPDWNPAEMIGLHPRPLALSLYRSLITDLTWAEARKRYGYRDLCGTPLLMDFAGLPYIDVRASAASLLPAGVPDAVAHKLVDHAVDTLAANPHLHDKLESQVVVSAHGLRTDTRMASLDVLDNAERSAFTDTLRALTDRLVTSDLVWHDLDQLRGLDSGPVFSGPAGVAQLVTRCVQFGTLPFAGLARAAFVATELLDDLVTEGVLDPADKAAFIASLDLVSSELRRGFATLDRDAFLKRYGHLRPGTYDILSPRYDEQPEVYFDWSAPREDVAPPPEFRLTGVQRLEVERLIRAAGLSFGADRLLEFAGSAIRGRELAKFEFTRVLSDVLVAVRRLGEQCGLDAAEMSYVDIQAVATLTGNPRDNREILCRAIERGRERHDLGQSVSLPPLITGPADVWSFRSQDTRPNFVTRGRAVGPVADIDAGDPPEGAIAMIASADPGYDWLFARGIAGLVTAFGGVNSHMALRALELGVPAVIGVGEAQFRRWTKAAGLDIDAASELVAVLT